MYRILESVHNYMNDPATQDARRKAMDSVCLLVNPESWPIATNITISDNLKTDVRSPLV